MAAHAYSTVRRAATPAHAHNIGTTERWISTAAGLGLAFSAAGGGSSIGRLVRGVAAVTLLARGATGFCAMRGALTGQTSFQEGLKEQWRRISAGLTSSAASDISTMETMYVAELQELHSAEQQLFDLTRQLSRALEDPSLRARIDSYAAEVSTRKNELDDVLARSRANPRAHPDDAMQALVHEAIKMTQVPQQTLREAALTASLQRIIHYKIAGYGTIAAYAKALGHMDEAARFAGFADRDKAMDTELSDIAKSTLNPEAARAPEVQPPEAQPPESMRAH